MTTTTTRISLLQRFILWREAHISERIFVLILSFIIGILTALAAFALKQLIGTIQHLLMPAIRQANVWYLILPPIGVLLTAGVVKLFIRDDISHGDEGAGRYVTAQESYQASQHLVVAPS